MIFASSYNYYYQQCFYIVFSSVERTWSFSQNRYNRYSVLKNFIYTVGILCQMNDRVLWSSEDIIGSLLSISTPSILSSIISLNLHYSNSRKLFKFWKINTNLWKMLYWALIKCLRIQTLGVSKLWLDNNLLFRKIYPWWNYQYFQVSISENKCCFLCH